MKNIAKGMRVVTDDDPLDIGVVICLDHRGDQLSAHVQFTKNCVYIPDVTTLRPAPGEQQE